MGNCNSAGPSPRHSGGRSPALRSRSHLALSRSPTKTWTVCVSARGRRVRVLGSWIPWLEGPLERISRSNSSAPVRNRIAQLLMHRIPRSMWWMLRHGVGLTGVVPAARPRILPRRIATIVDGGSKERDEISRLLPVSVRAGVAGEGHNRAMPCSAESARSTRLRMARFYAAPLIQEPCWRPTCCRSNRNSRSSVARVQSRPGPRHGEWHALCASG